jgi:hypothetical protein
VTSSRKWLEAPARSPSNPNDTETAMKVKVRIIKKPQSQDQSKIAIVGAF